MEYTKNNLSDKNIIFFKNLSETLETKLYFFGSVQRKDYFPGKSDIDIDIFTDNMNSTLFKMQHFLNVKKSKFKKFVWRLNNKQRNLVDGYKIMYRDPDNSLSAEFSIYNEKYKYFILKEHKQKINLPFYASWLLILLKFIYYDLNLLNKKTFIYCKKNIMSFMIGLPKDEFIVY